MKAIAQDEYGSPDVLELRDVPVPEVADDAVLVRVHAASVNARDWHVMRGDPYIARLSMGVLRPKVTIQGTDFAGRVEAVGRSVTEFAAGDEVFGEVAEAFAEYVSAPAGMVVRKPAGLTFEQAAAIPLAANTALMGLRDVGRVRPGQRVLVNGASGGVGTFAVQIAGWLGADVTAVCSERNIDLVRSLGADHVIDYRREDFSVSGSRYDVVFDLVGNHSLTDLRRVLESTGTLVLSGGGVSRGGSFFGPIGLIVKGQLTSRLRDRRVHVLTVSPNKDNLQLLSDLAEARSIIPVIDRTYGLDEVPDAIGYLEREHARAKVVITV